jgi:hypothetical protein
MRASSREISGPAHSSDLCCGSSVYQGKLRSNVSSFGVCVDVQVFDNSRSIKFDCSTRAPSGMNLNCARSEDHQPLISEQLRDAPLQWTSGDWNILSDHRASAIPGTSCDRGPFRQASASLLLRPPRYRPSKIHSPRSGPTCANIPSAISHFPWSRPLSSQIQHARIAFSKIRSCRIRSDTWSLD